MVAVPSDQLKLGYISLQYFLGKHNIKKEGLTTGGAWGERRQCAGTHL